MGTSLRPIRYWLPRILGMLFVLLTSIFASDAWSEGLAAVLVHLVPTYLTIAILLVAWRWGKTGGAVYVALGLAYTVFTHFDWTAKALIGGIPLVVGLLFYFGPQGGLLTERPPNRSPQAA